MKRKIVVSLLALGLVAALIAASPAQAKKPVSSSAGNSVSLVTPNPKLGDWVTFNYSYSGNVQSPRIEIDCYQAGVMTFASAAPANQAQQLGGAGSVWLTNGGSADCTAILYYWDFHPNQVFNELARTTFTAAGN